jgi:membrane protein implicated in regulation of membrane protease activity
MAAANSDQRLVRPLRFPSGGDTICGKLKHMTWWIWIVIGLVLAALELASAGGFFVIFFGVGALAVGVLSLIGVAQAAWVQWLLFPLIALVSLRLFRQPLMSRMGIRDGGHDVDSLVGQIATPDSSIEPGGHGRAELRGTTWSARNVDTTLLTTGQRCRVVAVHGLMLDLRSE